jgi:hypothetical protein
MKSWIQQLNIFRKANQIRQALRPIRFTEHHVQYYQKQYQENRSDFFKFILFTFGIILFEVTAPLYLDRIFRSLGYSLNVTYLFLALGALAVVLSIYIYFNYQGIKIKKTLALKVVNKIREDWLTSYLDRKALGVGLRDQASLYVKLSYHLSLFQMGLSNSLLAVVEWVFMFIGILTVSAIFSKTLFILSLVLLPIPLFVFLVSYYLSAYYLAQDQTLYSRLMRMITINFGNFPMLKDSKRREAFFSKINNTVELDTYFRVRRELVLRLSPKIIFAIVSFISVAFYLINLYGSFSEISGLEPIVHTLVFALYLKFIYLSLNVGLFIFPLRLGAYLVTPRASQQAQKEVPKLNNLEVYASKIKLHNQDSKKQKLQLQFQKGSSYLVCIPDEKEHLAHLLAGYSLGFGTKKWMFKINDSHRFDYQDWSSLELNRFYINLQYYPETKVVDYLGGMLHIEKLAAYPVFSFIFERKSFLNERVHQSTFKPHEFALLQIAYVILHKPDIAIIDPLVIDLPYKQVHEAVSIMIQELRESLVVGVSHHYPVSHTSFEHVSHL